MAREYAVFQIDAFTARRFEGNPAGVVVDARGLTDGEMQAIARELNNSETAFILPPDADDHDVRIRYFTPSVEVPFCGHATVAAHYARAISGQLSSGRTRQKCLAGIIDVQVDRSDDDYRVSLTQLPPVFEPPLDRAVVDAIFDGVGGDIGDLRADCPVQVVSTGHSKVLIGLRSLQALARLTPDAQRLTAVSREIGSNGYHFFAMDAVEPDVLTTCRMFAPAIGILEDPVTGNGNGPLGAYLVRHHLIDHPRDGELTFRSSQGHAVRRPGIVEVTVTIEAGEPTGTRVAGSAVLVFSATLSL